MQDGGRQNWYALNRPVIRPQHPTAMPAIMNRQPFFARPELLAPAGDFDAACAALQYGADAVYAGLSRFSARADAANLSPEELRRLVAHAHALPRPRRVYVALNTLAQERELAGAIETLEELDDIGVDAVIVQDLGIHRIARRCFPRLRLHASTQLAVHNLAGARALAGLGFRRVVLARELTLAEAARIGREADLEVEVFVHGALCYSYSGLCLFSSHQTGRSGNRGRCAYCCREPLAPAGNSPDGGFIDEGQAFQPAFPFSMRDLALAPRMPELAADGIASLKIEGRMKNAFYVACVTDYYRRKLDGNLTPDEEAALVQDLQTIFSRPWTQLYAAGRETPATEIIDAAAVGHRGAPVGEAQAVTRDSQGDRWLRFQTRRALEKHDGLQIDSPRGGKPFGFAVDALRRAGSNRLEIGAPAGATVEVRLPDGESPALPAGATIFCSASQAVRRRYQVQRPRPSDCRLTRPVQVRATLRPEGITLTATVSVVCLPQSGVSASITMPMALTPARQPDQTAAAVRRALAKSGDTPWQVAALDLDDPQGLFAPASALNEARRKLFEALTAQQDAARQARRAEAGRIFAVGNGTDIDKERRRQSAALQYECQPAGDERNGGRRSVGAVANACPPPRWTAKVDLAGPTHAALANADEIILHLGHLPPAEARAQLETWLPHMPRARLRLALPLITRQHEEDALHATVSALLSDGWKQWECADIGGWQVLRDATREPLDLTADWSIYGLNHAARDLLAELGMTRAVASPEDTEENMAALAAHGAPEIEALVWQQTPLFLSETPPLAGEGREPPWTLVNRRGGRLITHRLDNRWATVAEKPFSLAGHLPALRRHGVRWFRADFLWSPPDAVCIPDCWSAVQSGRILEAVHEGNFLRGLT
jgi:putative protease